LNDFHALILPKEKGQLFRTALLFHTPLVAAYLTC
jgi:hypothetical protein